MRRASLLIPILSIVGVVLLGGFAHRAMAQGQGGPRIPRPITDADYRNNGVVDADQAELGRLLLSLIHI